MRIKNFWFNFLIFFWGAILVYGWNHYSDIRDSKSWKGSEPSKLNKTGHYCYHFTWMGSKFNKWTFKNIRNKTCKQYFKDKKTLCINPMVATEKGGKPDLNYILNNHAAEATCRLSEQHVCVKYVVYNNEIPELIKIWEESDCNPQPSKRTTACAAVYRIDCALFSVSYETRYCSIINVDKEHPMQAGCIQEKRGSDVIEVCACRSQPGPDGICNSSTSNSGTKVLMLAALLHLIHWLF